MEQSLTPEALSPRSETSTTPTPSTYASSSQTQSTATSPETYNTPLSTKPQYLRFSNETIAALRGLRPFENILLLTPIVPPPLKRSQTTDPFEPLGIALSAYHSRIRHAPFHPSMDTNHLEDYFPFLEQASAIIMVVCHTLTPMSSPDTSEERSHTSSHLTTSAQNQMEILQNICEIITQQIPGPPKPTVLITIGEEIGTCITPSTLAQCSIILHEPSYTHQALPGLADELFRAHTSANIAEQILIKAEPERIAESYDEFEMTEKREDVISSQVDELKEDIATALNIDEFINADA